MKAPTQTAVQKAMDAAINGPNVEDLKVFGHDWNIQKGSVRRNNGNIIVSGKFSHNVDWQRNDQIHYEFVFEKGKMIKNDITIDDRGWASIASTAVGAFVGHLTGGSISADDIEPLIKKIEGLVTGDWQTAAHKLALRIGLEGYKVKST